MSKTKLILNLSSDFKTLSRNELKNVLGGWGSWCFTNGDCHMKTLKCPENPEVQVWGKCNGRNWFGMGHCAYPACVEIGELVHIE
jgi:bacteriocin-like protein